MFNPKWFDEKRTTSNDRCLFMLRLLSRWKLINIETLGVVVLAINMSNSLRQAMDEYIKIR